MSAEEDAKTLRDSELAMTIVSTNDGIEKGFKMYAKAVKRRDRHMELEILKCLERMIANQIVWLQESERRYAERGKGEKSGKV